LLSSPSFPASSHSCEFPTSEESSLSEESTKK
jgi:hypothetical protein